MYVALLCIKINQLFSMMSANMEIDLNLHSDMQLRDTISP